MHDLMIRGATVGDGMEQKILHIAHHMAGLAADGYGVAAAAGKCLSQALFRVEGFAPLIEDHPSEGGGEAGQMRFAALLGAQPLGPPAGGFKDAPVLHVGIEQFQGSAASVDLVVMCEPPGAFVHGRGHTLTVDHSLSHCAILLAERGLVLRRPGRHANFVHGDRLEQGSNVYKNAPPECAIVPAP